MEGRPETVAGAAEVAAERGGVEAGVDAGEKHNEVFGDQVRHAPVVRGHELGLGGFPGSGRCGIHGAELAKQGEAGSAVRPRNILGSVVDEHHVFLDGRTADVKLVGGEVGIRVAYRQPAQDRQFRRDCQLLANDLGIARDRNLDARPHASCGQGQQQRLQVHPHAHPRIDPCPPTGHNRLVHESIVNQEDPVLSTILVTGGSGFIGSHCLLQLLAAGHQVRTTVRSLKREGDVRAMLKEGDAAPADRLSFFEANLESDAGWPPAVDGCEYVLHVASPFPPAIPRNEDELIRPAREGTLRVLRAARDAGVKRVVLTSSFAAIGYGQEPRDTPFNETNWTDPSGADVQPYTKSKTLAERAAWDFIAREGGQLELSVINPVGVFGPILGPDYSTSILLVQRLMDGAMPGCPKLYFGLVDVRDVADLHVRAMTHPGARGERFLAVAGDFVSIAEIARMLKSRMGAAARRVPTRRTAELGGAAGRAA